MVSGIWSGDPEITLITGTAVIAAVVGMYQHVYPQKKIRWIYFLLGVLFAVSGPKITFLGLPQGEYLYLNDFISVALTGAWLQVFPILIQELDNIRHGWPPSCRDILNFAGSYNHVRSIFARCFLYKFDWSFASGVFWSRHGHMYRRLGESLSAFWGFL